MTRAPRLLVVEGNTPKARARQAEYTGQSYSEAYSDVLRGIAPDAVVDICFPTDEGANIPDVGGIEGYDGIAITGSSLNLYKAEPESLKQVELVRSIFETGVPIFGSCWGLQVGAVAAGGTVVKSRNGREIGLARKITLTEEGRAHDLHAGKGPEFRCARRPYGRGRREAEGHDRDRDERPFRSSGRRDRAWQEHVVGRAVPSGIQRSTRWPGSCRATARPWWRRDRSAVSTS